MNSRDSNPSLRSGRTGLEGLQTAVMDQLHSAVDQLHSLKSSQPSIAREWQFFSVRPEQSEGYEFARFKPFAALRANGIERLRTVVMDQMHSVVDQQFEKLAAEYCSRVAVFHRSP
ncbi:MAG: hypothetical protein H7203_00230 [Rhizobacter sp.]|nr:hypothetical protein [Burkholderiales bacterium]